MSSNELVILNELKKILVTDINKKNNNVVSLYDLSKLMNSKHIEYDNLTKKYQDYLSKKVSNDVSVKIYNFNYKKEALLLEVKLKNIDKNHIVAFTKQNNTFGIQSKDNSFDNVLMPLKNDLKDIYKKFMKFYEFMTEDVYFKKTINSKFEFTVYNSCLFINYRNDLGLLENFDITYYNKNNNYEYDTNSNDILAIIKDNEDEIFKKIYVNIKDCPKWSRETLHNIRREQLENSKQKNLRI